MNPGKPSATARLLAAAAVLSAHDPATRGLVPPEAARWSGEFLSTSAVDRALRASCRWAAGRAAWRGLERATHPGIVRHWMLRKRWIEGRVRASIADGAGQLVVLGAGLDTLGVRLAAECPAVRVVEVDHPATLALKQQVTRRISGKGGPILAEADFSAEGQGQGGPVLPAGLIDRGLATVFVAEGLLMYLAESGVRRLLGELAAATDGSSSKLVFSAMVGGPGRAIGFEPRSRAVSWWLAWKGEPFRWSLDPAGAAEFARSLGWSIAAHADSRALDRQDGAPDKTVPIARGEDVYEAVAAGSG